MFSGKYNVLGCATEEVILYIEELCGLTDFVENLPMNWWWKSQCFETCCNVSSVFKAFVTTLSPINYSVVYRWRVVLAQPAIYTQQNFEAQKKIMTLLRLRLHLRPHLPNTLRVADHHDLPILTDTDRNYAWSSASVQRTIIQIAGGLDDR